MKKIKNIMAIVLLFAVGGLSAQDFVSRLVETEFAKYEAPKVIEDILMVDNTYDGNSLQKEVRTSKVFKYNQKRAIEVIRDAAQLQSLGLYTDTGEYIIVDLVNAFETFATATAVTSKGETFNVNELVPAVYYRGVIRGQEKVSLVSIKISEKEISGFISSPDGNLVVGKLKDSDAHVIYNDANLLQKFDFTCGTPDRTYEENKTDFMPKNIPLLAKCVYLHYETEYDMVQELGTLNNVVDFVTNLHNQVATLYYNEGIPTPLSSVSVWLSTDPYTADIQGGLLGQFKSNTSSFNGNLNQLLTFRSVGGGVADGLNGICNSNVDASLSVSGLYSWQDIKIPQYSWNVNVITHEFGHLMGSDHTHACAWNGNNTAIDGCGYVAGYGGCNAPIPVNGGTVMSYCHLQYSINFYNGFGQQPGDRIRNKVNNGSCLDYCNGCIPELTIFTPVTTSQSFAVSNTLTASSVISNNITVAYQGNAVVLKPGFHVSGNTTGRFRAIASSCALLSVDSFGFSEESNETLLETTEITALVLAPNPSSEKVTVTSSKGMVKITVTSLDGGILFDSAADGKIQSFDLDISRYYKGLYLVTVVNADGEVITEKLIKE